MGVFSRTTPNSGERVYRGYTKFDLTVDEEKEALKPSRDKEEKASTSEGRWSNKRNKNKKNSRVLAFLLCDSGWCAQKVKSGGQNGWGDNTRNTHHLVPQGDKNGCAREEDKTGVTNDKVDRRIEERRDKTSKQNKQNRR